MKLLNKARVLTLSLIGAMSLSANAIIPEIDPNDPQSLYAASAKLSCTTPDTCGNYTADFPLQVYYVNNEARLFWSQNKPRGIAAGQFTAYTEGADCPAGSTLSKMRAKWFLGLNLKPYRAETTHCDGTTISKFYIQLSGVTYVSGFGGM